MVGMNDQELKEQMTALSKRVEEVYGSVERIRKYFLIMVIASVVALVLPLVGLLFAIPSFLSTYSEMSESGLLEGL